MWIVLGLVVLYVGCILFVRWRNSVSFPLSRQLSDFSTFMVPFNIPSYLLSAIPTTPRVSSEHLPQVKLLLDNWETIRDEALALYEGGLIATKSDLPASSFYKDNRWKSFYLKAYDHPIPSAWEKAPKTMALINQVENMNLALFAVLMPGKKLSSHHDPFSYTVRFSLGLSTPNDPRCGLTIDGEKYTWRDGEGVIFDETYFHDAFNETEVPRIILMTDIDRPLKWKWVQKIYFHFGRFFNGLFYIDNLDEQNSGIGNKLGKGVMAYKTFLKSIKRRNRTFYQLSKWAVILLVLYGLASLIW